MSDRLPVTAPCSTCGAPVHWGVTASGRRMPLDPGPDEGGDLVLEDGRFVAFEPLLHGDVPRYVSHFATCPDAEQHRKEGKR